jgi:hypothetical protein
MNAAFGWIWITAGLVSGMVLGLGFARENFLGGYGSWKRRLLRLGHIAQVMLGVMNVLFEVSRERMVVAPVWVDVAAWGMVIGAVLMPAVCALAAFDKRAMGLFGIPVIALIGSSAIVAVGVTRGVL